MTATAARPISDYRRALRERFGIGNYRITRDGGIHARGPLPNAQQLTGWHLWGWLHDAQTEARLFNEE